MNAVARAIAAASQAAQRLAGVEVTYKRGALSVELCAVAGKTRYELADEEGLVAVYYARDYLIRADELVLDGELIQPQLGDTIDETQTDGTHTYKVIDLPGEPAWRWSDEQRVRARVHTKEIAKP